MQADLLKGIKIVDFTTYAAAPCSVRMLADWGADVIKVEGFSGDPMRKFGVNLGDTPYTDDENPVWEYENGNKRDISIDLKTEKGMEIMHKLLSEADAFVSNVRAGSLKKLGLDYETLHEKYPKLVVGVISGYGLYGKDIIQIFRTPVFLRRRDDPFRRGHGLLVAADLHLLFVQLLLERGHEPVKDLLMDYQGFAGVAYADPLCLGVEDNGNRHIDIRALVHIDVAVACAGLDHRNPAVFHHAADEPRPAPGDQHVHVLVHLHESLGRLPAGILDELDRVLRDAFHTQRAPDHVHDGLIGVERVAAAS